MDYLLIEYLRIIIVVFLEGVLMVLNFWVVFDLVKLFNCLNEISIDIL